MENEHHKIPPEVEMTLLISIANDGIISRHLMILGISWYEEWWDNIGIYQSIEVSNKPNLMIAKEDVNIHPV